MPQDHSTAIIRWREQLDVVGPGLDAFDQTATVSTMLFACRSWLRNHAPAADPQMQDKIQYIDNELTSWMTDRGLAFTG
ncbi:hypothetical protein [Devosia sp. FJ2-5-3]|uniref:hypothetical protein n=1 Tax=Devosia sp. FJ2-5-3 TaxID=2976680 RepID=UPI0023D88CA7|nr:hypothetical protein [Devosia sp. FJ2-5-3]WEJ56761.1 hypothetical protein N0P34_11050 [Devosia sp. FJ2-5-3]